MDSEMEGKALISQSKTNHEAVYIVMENLMAKSFASEKQAALPGGCHPVTEIWKTEMAKYRQSRKQHKRERSRQRQRDRGRKQGRRQGLKRRRTRGTVFQGGRWKVCHRMRLSEKP